MRVRPSGEETMEFSDVIFQGLGPGGFLETIPPP